MDDDGMCTVCGRPRTGGTFEASNVDRQCDDCIRRYPAPLLKACADSPWTYALRLGTGELILFEGATIKGDWADLHGCTVRPAIIAQDVDLGIPAQVTAVHRAFTFDRGMTVRVACADIVWSVDAPWGS